MALRALLIITLAAIFVCCIFGCGKKSKNVPEKNSVVPAGTTATAKADSQAIFDEFYKDAKNATADGKSGEKTFSMNPAASKAPDSYSPQFSKRGRYTVQISSMDSRELAEELAARFKERGFPAYTTEIEDPAVNLGGTYYRVRIGGFQTITEAKAFGENVLKPAKYDYWVDRKANERKASKAPAGSYSPLPDAPAPIVNSSQTPAPMQPAASTTIAAPAQAPAPSQPAAAATIAAPAQAPAPSQPAAAATIAAPAQAPAPSSQPPNVSSQITSSAPPETTSMDKGATSGSWRDKSKTW